MRADHMCGFIFIIIVIIIVIVIIIIVVNSLSFVVCPPRAPAATCL